ncbi:hypothetical protein AKJ16_DCAP14913 [Drosera capensis]
MNRKRLASKRGERGERNPPSSSLPFAVPNGGVSRSSLSVVAGVVSSAKDSSFQVLLHERRRMWPFPLSLVPPLSKYRCPVVLL